MTVLLVACKQEDDVTRDTGKVPPVVEQIDRARKGDRLRVADRSVRQYLAEVRAAALRSFGVRTPLDNFYRALSDRSSGFRSQPVTVLHPGDGHIAAFIYFKF